MSISRGALRSFLPGVLAILLFPAFASAIEESAPMHWTADKKVWDRRNNKVELEGHAVVRQPGETLTADHITLDLAGRTLDARGNCVYFASETVIYGDEMHFNLDTRTGSIVGGRVSSTSFTLTGERINKLGEGRFQTHRGGYTTCLDCPGSWTLMADDVDLQFDGYAFMKNVTAKVKDSPIFWLPYLIVPVKTRRQTGLLLPRDRSLGLDSFGFRIVPRFFWAINRSSDITIGLGEYGGRGLRGEWEGRYQLSEINYGRANLFYLHDKTFQGTLLERGVANRKDYGQRPHRWALNLSQRHQLPYGIDEKLHLVDISDNLYPNQIQGDVDGYGDAYIASDLIFSHATSQVSSYVAARRFRNLLNRDPLEFDPSTVQVYPSAALTTNDRFLLGGPLAVGLTLGLTNFTRTDDGFDRDPVVVPGETPRADPNQIILGRDPVRKATRFSFTPRLYTTLRPLDTISIVPSFEYRGFFYSFHNDLPNLSRGYALFQTDVSAQLERIYDTGNPDEPKVKHLIRPLITYSLIPRVDEDQGHPFIQQMERARKLGFSGYNFDNYDIVPLEQSRTYSNYFVPLGHSLSYGFTTQVVRRKGKVEDPAANYQTNVDFKAGQTLNFKEYENAPGDRRPLSRFFSSLYLSFGKSFSSSIDYSYFPYLPINAIQDRHVLSTTLNYVFERATHQRILAFERSISLAYTRSRTNSRTENVRGVLSFSLNDYLSPTATVSRDLVSHRWLEVSTVLRFQSPSQCWRMDIGVTRTLCDQPDRPFCVGPIFDLALNLAGTGFGGVGEISSAVAK